MNVVKLREWLVGFFFNPVAKKNNTGKYDKYDVY